MGTDSCSTVRDIYNKARTRSKLIRLVGHKKISFYNIIFEMTDDEFDYPFEWLKIRSKYNLVNSKPILSNVSLYNLYRWKNYGWVEWSKGGMCGVVMGGNDNPFFQTNDIRIEKSILVGKAKKVRTLIEYIKK